MCVFMLVHVCTYVLARPCVCVCLCVTAYMCVIGIIVTIGIIMITVVNVLFPSDVKSARYITVITYVSLCNTPTSFSLTLITINSSIIILIRYRNTYVWMDGTVAYSVAKEEKSWPVRKSCGVYCCAYQYYIITDFCRRTTANEVMCEFKDPIDSSSSELTERIHLPRVFTPSSNRSVHHLISCPLGHTTHAFLACDMSSMCFATRETFTYDERDTPSHTSCPATSRPPSFQCTMRGGRVPFTSVCDHRQDCSDNSDEGFCNHPPCGEHISLQCGNSPQVAKTLFELTGTLKTNLSQFVVTTLLR